MELSLMRAPLRRRPNAEPNDGFPPRLCENSSVQFAYRKFFSIWPVREPKVLATATEGGNRESDSTLSWLAHVCTRPAPIADGA
jgi:hypothetical protein